MSITQKDKRWKYINLSPTPPMIRGLIKIHKADSPITPIVNWKNAPAYRLTKMLSKKLGIYIPLPYTFNVKITIQLMKDLLDIPYDQNLKKKKYYWLCIDIVLRLNKPLYWILTNTMGWLPSKLNILLTKHA